MSKWTVTVYYFDKLTVGGHNEMKNFEYDVEDCYAVVSELKNTIFRNGLLMHKDLVRGLVYEQWIAPAQIVGITISER